jgi:hypothetical protein
MNLKQKLTLTVAALAIAACAVWSAHCLLQQRNAAGYQARHLGAVAALNDQFRQQLHFYYGINHCYPEKLTDLTTVNTSAGNVRPEVLDAFSYVTGPGHYVITWTVQFDDDPSQAHKEHAIQGKVTFIEDYLDGELQSRTEYSQGYRHRDTRVEKLYRNGRFISAAKYENGRKVFEETPGNK